jgi:hypothetical protein
MNEKRRFDIAYESEEGSLTQTVVAINRELAEALLVNQKKREGKTITISGIKEYPNGQINVLRD